MFHLCDWLQTYSVGTVEMQSTVTEYGGER